MERWSRHPNTREPARFGVTVRLGSGRRRLASAKSLEGAATASERTINRRVEVRLVTISNELSLASRRRRDG
mgnify:CR=1 FL=1